MPEQARSAADATAATVKADKAAVESAKRFCAAEAPAFVNGVLGAILREVRENAQIR